VRDVDSKGRQVNAFQEYYHLKRDSFAIDPWADADVYFGAGALHERIRERIETDFVQPRAVPKFFIYGPYGGGKTHTLAHIRQQLITHDAFAKDFPTEPVYLEIAPIRGNERWVAVHERLLNSIGLTRLKQAVSAVFMGADPGQDPVSLLEERNILRFGDDALKASQAQIFRHLLFSGRPEMLSWEWLKGRQLKIDDAQILGIQTNLSGTPTLVAALLNVGSLISAGLGRKVVFLVDEGEALNNLTNADAIDDFAFAFRRLVDNENNVVGMVVAYESAGGMEKAPRLLQGDDIRRRVDYDLGYIDLTQLVADPTEAREFILQVLRHLIDQAEAAKTIKREGLDIEPEYFPFTAEAVDAIADFVTEDPERAVPSQILSLMSAAVIAGWRKRSSSSKRIVVDSDLASFVMYPEDRVSDDSAV